MTSKVFINSCDPQELLRIPGVNDEIQQNIIALLDQMGDICPEDLWSVAGLNISRELLASIDFRSRHTVETMVRTDSTTMVPNQSHSNQNVGRGVHEDGDGDRAFQQKMLSAISTASLSGPPVVASTPMIPRSNDNMGGRQLISDMRLRGLTGDMAAPNSDIEGRQTISETEGYSGISREPETYGEPRGTYRDVRMDTRSQPLYTTVDELGSCTSHRGRYQATEGQRPKQTAAYAGENIQPAFHNGYMNRTMGLIPPGDQEPGNVYREGYIGRYRENRVDHGPHMFDAGEYGTMATRPKTLPDPGYKSTTVGQYVDQPNYGEIYKGENSIKSKHVAEKSNPGSYPAYSMGPEFSGDWRRGGQDLGFRYQSNNQKRTIMPKSISFDGKGNWQAFLTKFTSFANEQGWTGQECKNQLCWCLEGKASEFFATMTERNPTLGY